MATETRNLGLSAIEVGAIAADGGVATTFAPLGVTYKDTAEISQEDGEKIEHFCEEQDDAIEVIQSKGKTTVKWAIVDFSPSNLKKIFGGTVTGTAPNDKWEVPVTTEEVEMSVKVTPKKGKPFTFPRCKLNGKINYKLAKSGIAQVEITATVLQPTKSGVASLTFG